MELPGDVSSPPLPTVAATVIDTAPGRSNGPGMARVQENQETHTLGVTHRHLGIGDTFVQWIGVQTSRLIDRGLPDRCALWTIADTIEEPTMD